MQCIDIIEKLDQLAPQKYSMSWDNVGLLAGRKQKEVTRVLVALDATQEVVDLAISLKIDLLITHHPLLFRAVKKIDEDDFITKRIIKLIQNDIVCFAMHTNFDVAPGCMADVAASRLGILNGRPLEPTMEEGGKWLGVGMVGDLANKMTLVAFANRVKEVFHLPYVTVFGGENSSQLIERIAICPGAGGSMVSLAVDAGADLFLTGDITHHKGIDGTDQGLLVMDAGHYGLEHLFIDAIKQYLKTEFGDQLCVYEAERKFPMVLM